MKPRSEINTQHVLYKSIYLKIPTHLWVPTHQLRKTVLEDGKKTLCGRALDFIMRKTEKGRAGGFTNVYVSGGEYLL